MIKQAYKVQCRWCKAPHVLEIDPEDVQDWQNGKHIQNAMPYLSADQRELLVSGTCGKCWDEMFPEEEETV